LDRIGAKLRELPAARRKAIEIEPATIERKAGHSGAEPKDGATMTRPQS
jgi:hypothetical protein